MSYQFLAELPIETVTNAVIVMNVAILVAFLYCLALYPLYIKWLVSKQLGQFIREEGPASHAVKAKTPTMGGLCFIAGTVVTAAAANLFFDTAGNHPDEVIRIALTLAAAIACGLLGLADDYGKIRSKSNAGISAKFRLLSEFGIGLVLGLCLHFIKINGSGLMPSLALGMFLSEGGVSMRVLTLSKGICEVLYCLLLSPFLMAACSNSLNLHDGMDGLAGGTSMLVLATLAMMLCLSGHYGLAWLAAAGVGALLGFLVYNKYPAKVFMGDTGSLFIGAFMAGLVVCGGLVFWFVPLSLIYIVEAVSVMAQVVYFKLTKTFTPEKPMNALSLLVYKLTHRLPGEGKRLFRMAPIHHHFEALALEKGKPEATVVTWFWVVQLAICAACFLCFKQ